MSLRFKYELGFFKTEIICELSQFYLDQVRLNEYNKDGILCLIIVRCIVMNGYITVQEAADKWGITSRQVQVLCKDNRVKGATKMSRIWIIPENTPKPTMDKRKAGKING